MTSQLPIDPAEWDLVIDKLVRFHDNIQLEIVGLLAAIKKEMNGAGSSMVPIAEEKSTFGKVSREPSYSLQDVRTPTDDSLCNSEFVRDFAPIRDIHISRRLAKERERERGSAISYTVILDLRNLSVRSRENVVNLQILRERERNRAPRADLSTNQIFV